MFAKNFGKPVIGSLQNNTNMKTYTVKPILRTDKKKKNGACPVNIRVTHNSKQLKFPTELEATEKTWSKQSSCFTKGEPNYVMKNNRLHKYKST